jgi:hypothetical protein
MEAIILPWEMVHICHNCSYYHIFREKGEEIEEFSIGVLDISNHLEYDAQGIRHTYSVLRFDGDIVEIRPDRMPLTR